MTEETIKNTLTETRKQVLSAESHYEIAAKQILEQHDAEMVLFAEFIRDFSPAEYARNGEKCWWSDSLQKSFSYTDLLTLFKNRNK